MHRCQLLIEGIHYYKVKHSLYKYCLSQDIRVYTPVIGKNVSARYFDLSPAGVLIGKAGYHWDGASGPTLDTPNSMRGSLVHDIFYQMLRDGQLINGEYSKRDHQRLRKIADKLIYTICRTDGMPAWRARAWYWGVRMFGAKYTKPRYW